jgi:acyl-CoA dehydrogenase
MVDEGVVCAGQWQGKEVLGMRLNWHKRYITLGPVCTVLGLAFKLRDPDHLLGEQEDIGITCALVPTDLPGVIIGRRHLPAFQLPERSQLGRTSSSRWTYHRRRRAGRPGLEDADERAGGRARRSRCRRCRRGGGLQRHDHRRLCPDPHPVQPADRQVRGRAGAPGPHRRQRLSARRRAAPDLRGPGPGPPSVGDLGDPQASGATERMRVVVNDAMDVHGGKAIIEGPRNYMGSQYRAVPVGITVEGANILTRSLMVFGQGAIRAHPYLLDEILAIGEADRAKGARRFRPGVLETRRPTRSHRRSGLRAKLVGRAVRAAPDAGRATRFYRQLGRYSAAFALTSDIALLTLGGELKRKEMLSARLGDILSELYFLSGA